MRAPDERAMDLRRIAAGECTCCRFWPCQTALCLSCATGPSLRRWTPTRVERATRAGAAAIWWQVKA